MSVTSTYVIPDITMADLPANLRKRTVLDPESGCWAACLGWLDPDGYAQWNGRYAHRRLWEELVGPVPDGWHVDHVRARGCVWRCCIWLRHLEPVTVAVNNARKPQVTHCPKCTAEFDLINTVYVGNRRICRTCHPGAGTRPRRPARVEPVKLQRDDLDDAWAALADFGKAA